MFSPQFMKYLINYQKSEFTPESTKREVYFKAPKRGRKTLATVTLTILNK